MHQAANTVRLRRFLARLWMALLVGFLSVALTYQFVGHPPTVMGFLAIMVVSGLTCWSYWELRR